MIFDGFIRVYKEGRDEGPDEDAEKMLPEVTVEQLLRMLEVLPEQHFTQPPPRFSEASLVKTLEELGIGRPSTYASIIDTIQRRQYVDAGGQALLAHRHRRGRHRQADRALPRRRRRHLHRLHGEGTRRHRRRRTRQGADAPRVQRTVRTRTGEGRALVRTLQRGAGRGMPVVSHRGARPGQAGGEAGSLRQVRRLHELPGLQVHPQHGRQRPPRAGDARRDLPRVRQEPPEARRPIRTVHRLQRLPRLQVHQEGPARLDRRHLPAVQRGRADREAQPVRHDVLQLQPLPRL